jgi:xylose isomerase
VDLTYPLTDPGLTMADVRGALDRNDLKVIGITPEIYTRVFAKGAFTNPDPGVRRHAHDLITSAAGASSSSTSPASRG